MKYAGREQITDDVVTYNMIERCWWVLLCDAEDNRKRSLMFEFERFYACFSIRAYNVRKDCTHAGIDISMTYWTMFYYVYDLPHSICVKPIEYPSILDLKSKHTIFVFSMGFCQ